MKKVFACTLFAFDLLGLFAASSALAHKVGVYVYVENGQIKGEGYFAGGDKAKDCQVELQDAGGKTVGAAKTDDKGEFSLPRLQAAPPLKVILHAGQGHQGDYTLTAADLGAPVGETAPSATPASPAPSASVSAAELEQAVVRALDQRLAPLTAQVAKLAGERSMSLQDVIGGFGYILGLMGIATYVKSRQSGGQPKS